MNYELAKELKDAKFPATGGRGDVYVSPTEIDDYSNNAYVNDVYAPTLHELIEACGENFRTLHVTLMPSNAWHASGVNASPTEIIANFSGTTPEEAVARLWLALSPPDSKEIN